MFRLVLDKLAYTHNLFYCQDSVHVMVAYAAVVMIKVIFSIPTLNVISAYADCL